MRFKNIETTRTYDNVGPVIIWNTGGSKLR